ncbi:MAG: 6-phosphogluconolactonase [Alphaproteobacteria bacterium]|nr:6-phosphogluconolactonase [Alphaproteobacteria bacterium]
MTQTSRKIIIVADADELAHKAAARLIERIWQGSDPVRVCLTGGSSPQRLYRLLAGEPYRAALPWERVHWFMGDDRFVPEDDPRSNMGTARRAFLDACAARGHVHPIATSAESPDAAARLYQEELAHHYGATRLDPARPLFDFVLMGLGPDGHTASLFPHAAALRERERWVVGVAQAQLEPFVPRVTLTIPALASTREMLFLVGEAEKRDVLARVLHGDDLPAAQVRSDGDLVWLVTRDAAPSQADAA